MKYAAYFHNTELTFEPYLLGRVPDLPVEPVEVVEVWAGWRAG